MDWGLAADIATTLGVVIALAGVIVSLIFGIRAERAAASRSEAAARLSDDNLRKAMDALEEMVARTQSDLSAGQAPRVAWSMTYHSGDAFQLQNIGDKVACEVKVNPAPGSHMFFRGSKITNLAPGEATQFIAACSLATSDITMTVSWSEEDDDERRQWQYPLPPSTSRRK